MSDVSNSFWSAEDQLGRSFDTALTEALSKVDQAKAEVLRKLEV